MHWQFTPYSYLLVVTASISVALVFFAWLRRGTPGAETLALLMAGVCVWAVGYALELSGADLPTKVFWAKVEYLGIVTVPLAWLAFALQYTGREGWLTRRNVALLSAIPLVTLLLASTNEEHGLVWASTTLESSGPFLALDVGHGAWFWVHWSYSYLLLLLGTVLLVSMLARSLRLYRKQNVALLFAVLIPWAGNGAYVLGLGPIPSLDLTPFAFLFSGVAIALGVFRFRLLDLVPVARDNVIEGMSDGAVVVDLQDRIVDINPAAEHILGCPASEAVGKSVGQLVPGWNTLFEGYRQAKEAYEEVSLGEGKARRDYDLTLSPVVDRRGRHRGYVVLLRDVTEHKRAEEELAQRAVELARSNAELEQFAYSVSHDLRTPLRSMDGFGQILLEDYADELDEEGRGYLQRMRAGAQRMGELIDDLLNLSRLTRGEMRREKVDLSAMVRSIAEALQEKQPERRAEFLISDGLVANGDARLLKVALENLLGNAWKFTARKAYTKIEFAAVPHDGTRAYFVRDNGAGFDEAYADKLFALFQRLHRVDEFEGNGIGLATVQRIVHRHGGRIWAEGVPERGATFYFTL